MASSSRHLRQPLGLLSCLGLGLGESPRLLRRERGRMPPTGAKGAGRQCLGLVTGEVEATKIIRRVLPRQLPPSNLTADQHVNPLQFCL